jgi:hypothetical protein
VTAPNFALAVFLFAAKTSTNLEVEVEEEVHSYESVLQNVAIMIELIKARAP